MYGIILLILLIIFIVVLFINVMTFSTMISIFVGIFYFIAYPLIASIISSMILMFSYMSYMTSQVDVVSLLLISDLLYALNLGYYPYSLLYHGYEIIFGHPNSNLSGMMSSMLPLYPTTIDIAIGVILVILIIPPFLTCLRMSRKNFKD